MGVPVMAMRYLARSKQMDLLPLVEWFLILWASSKMIRFHLIFPKGLSYNETRNL